MPLDHARLTYRPFEYPWMFEAWKTQQEVHWLPNEVPMADDIRDWNHRLTVPECNLLTQIFRFFTQADVEVQECYAAKYAQVFKPTECRMMLTAFSNMETVHIAAYSHLLDSIGMPEVEYQAFLKYAEMKAKHDYMASFNVEDPYQVARTLAAFGAFTEGLQLFASFAILMNFPRFNKMKGMGQIVTWSVRDETLHTNNIIRLYHTWLAEHPEINLGDLHADNEKTCREIVAHEDAFIDLAFSMGPIEGITPEQVKAYIRFIADWRLGQLGMAPIYGIKEHPLPWLDSLLTGHEHANFFEQRATEYSKAATKGSWDDVWTT